VNFDPTTGMSGRNLSKNGIAPMWSSCAWVITNASMSSSAFDVPQVRQDQVDAGLVVSGNITRSQ